MKKIRKFKSIFEKINYQLKQNKRRLLKLKKIIEDNNSEDDSSEYTLEKMIRLDMEENPEYYVDTDEDKTDSESSEGLTEDLDDDNSEDDISEDNGYLEDDEDCDESTAEAFLDLLLNIDKIKDTTSKKKDKSFERKSEKLPSSESFEKDEEPKLS